MNTRGERRLKQIKGHDTKLHGCIAADPHCLGIEQPKGVAQATPQERSKNLASHGSELSDKALKIRKATGTVDDLLADIRLVQAVVTCPFLKNDGDGFIVRTNSVLAALCGISPQDDIEGMLAVQMIGTHNLAMEFLARAIAEGQTLEGASENVNRATKLLRTYTAQVETLGKYRNKGRQTVTIKHVHVNEGGQAIVGIVNGMGGRGDSGEK